jgi:glucose/arabinose dehydrogenase
MLSAALGFLAAASPSQAQAPAKPCAEDSGITLSPGFCATIFADKIGHARHLVMAPNGVLYVNTWSGVYYNNDTPPDGGFLVALKDTKGTGHADVTMRFGETIADGGHGGTGIGVFGGGLFAEINDRIVRYTLSDDIVPKGDPATILSDLPITGDHPMHPFTIDAKGLIYVDLGSATNTCEKQNRVPNTPGNDPCVEQETRAGIWRYDTAKTGQHFSAAERYATGLRNGEGLSIDAAGRIFATQHGRDQLSEDWPQLYTQAKGQSLPAEELVELHEGADFGWPKCYFDGDQGKLVLAPEYGGDGGKTVGHCAQKQAPVAFFPAHWAPDDLKIYTASQFPTPYRGGAFIAFHGSWNRAPAPQAGYNVVFQPMADGKATGKFIVFADGFAGAVKEPGRAAHRPTGIAIGPDGALYVSDDVGGRIYRITYTGGTDVTSLQGAADPTKATTASAIVLPPEGIHPNAGKSLPVPPGSTKEQVALGERVFLGEVDGGTCAGCHGTDAGGSPIGASLTAGKWLWSDGSYKGLLHTIANGVPKPKEHLGGMPPMGGVTLPKKDLEAVAAYVWAIGHQTGK